MAITTSSMESARACTYHIRVASIFTIASRRDARSVVCTGISSVRIATPCITADVASASATGFPAAAAATFAESGITIDATTVSANAAAPAATASASVATATVAVRGGADRAAE